LGCEPRATVAAATALLVDAVMDALREWGLRVDWGFHLCA